MNRTMLVVVFALLIAGCGGSSDKDDAPAPPAPTMPEPGGGVDDKPEPVDDEMEENLTLSCSKSPNMFAPPNGEVTATFNFSDSFDGSGVILAGPKGGFTSPQNITINDSKHVVTRNVQSSGVYSIRLTLTGVGLSAVCTWTISDLGEANVI